MKQVHGVHGDCGLEQPHWICAVAALHNTDLVASGTSRPTALGVTGCVASSFINFCAIVVFKFIKYVVIGSGSEGSPVSV